ncbi:MLP3C protein, partial [Polypterus senegalus]|nr:MLP3C protein [Polypterus senegalus]
LPWISKCPHTKHFKQSKTLATKMEEATGIRAKFPTKIPVVIEGKPLNPICDGDRGLQLFPTNEKFPVRAGHTLEMITSLPFVNPPSHVRVTWWIMYKKKQPEPQRTIKNQRGNRLRRCLEN